MKQQVKYMLDTLDSIIVGYTSAITSAMLSMLPEVEKSKGPLKNKELYI